MAKLTPDQLAALRALGPSHWGNVDRDAVLDHIDALTAELASAIRSRDLASAWGEEKQQQAIGALVRAEARADELRSAAARCARGECHDGALSRAEKAQAERDALKLALTKQTADHAEWRENFRKAHSLDVKREVERAEQAEAERDELVAAHQSDERNWVELHKRAEQAERERGETIERAEKAEAAYVKAHAEGNGWRQVWEKAEAERDALETLHDSVVQTYEARLAVIRDALEQTPGSASNVLREVKLAVRAALTDDQEDQA